MTPEERQMLADLFDRIRSTSSGPRDPQAEAFINDAVRAVPPAPYVLAQTVLVQQHALENLQQRVVELEAQAKAAAAPPPAQTSFLGSLFGGGSAAPPPPRPASSYDASAYQRGGGAPPPPPQQAYAPQQPYAPAQQYAPPQAGPWGAPAAPQSGGFLSNALHTAAGVAGGMVLANAVGSLFGGRSSGAFGAREFTDPGFGGGRETVNNYYNNAPDPAGQHAEDVLQDQDQDQDDAQDAGDNGGYDGGSDGGSDN